MDKNYDKVLIDLYQQNKSDLEIADFLKTCGIKMSERSVQRALSKLRIQGKIPARQNLQPELEKKSTIAGLKGVEVEEVRKAMELKWQVPVAKSDLVKKEFKSYLVIADTHVPYQNDPAVRSILSLCNDLPFDGFIIAGDFMDMTPISHWNKNKRKTLEMKRLKEDYIAGNVVLDEFDKRLPKGCDKKFLVGNHERFVDDLLEERPELEGFIEPATVLRLKERGYETYTEQNYILKLGKLRITHGMYAGVSPVRTHIHAFKTNVLFGHVHTEETKLESSDAKDIPIFGGSMGCLCDLNPAYLQNKLHRWSHGFAIVHLFNNGFFHVEMIRIVQGRFVYNSKLYDGNRK